MFAGSVALESPLRHSDEVEGDRGRKREISKGGMSGAMMRLLANTAEVRFEGVAVWELMCYLRYRVVASL